MSRGAFAQCFWVWRTWRNVLNSRCQVEYLERRHAITSRCRLLQERAAKVGPACIASVTIFGLTAFPWQKQRQILWACLRCSQLKAMDSSDRDWVYEAASTRNGYSFWTARQSLWRLGSDLEAQRRANSIHRCTNFGRILRPWVLKGEVSSHGDDSWAD